MIGYLELTTQNFIQPGFIPLFEFNVNPLPGNTSDQMFLELQITHTNKVSEDLCISFRKAGATSRTVTDCSDYVFQIMVIKKNHKNHSQDNFPLFSIEWFECLDF